MISPGRSHELLSEYVATRCGTAFRQLVAGWTGMVYGTALRLARSEVRRLWPRTSLRSCFVDWRPLPKKYGKPAGLAHGWTQPPLAKLWTLCGGRGVGVRNFHGRSSGAGRNPAEQMPERIGTGLAWRLMGAFNRLAPQDCQLLLMRFWQRQDCRSLGRNFGLSDDAAQRRIRSSWSDCPASSPDAALPALREFSPPCWQARLPATCPPPPLPEKWTPAPCPPPPSPFSSLPPPLSLSFISSGELP